MHLKLRSTATALAAVALIGSFALSSCAAPEEQPTSSAGNESVTIAMQTSINTYDPWTASSGFNFSLFGNTALYDSLTHLDADGNATPWLATEWSNTDASNWTLKLRNDVKFTDGTALDATAVVKNLEYSQKAQTPGECNSYLAGVSATAPDATTVNIKLARPNANLMVDFGTCAGFIVNPKALDDPDSLQSTPAGSGPYVIDESSSVAGQKWVFTRNPNYWANDPYPFDIVNLQYFSDVTAAANAGQSGQVQLIQKVDADTDTSGLKHLSAAQDFRGIFIADPSGELVKPLGDPKVKQALQMAIDRAAIVKSIFPTTGVVSWSTPFQEGTVGYTDAIASTFPYDPAKAKQLLADAGYPDGFSVKVMTDGDSINYLQAIAGYWKEIGVKLDISDQSADFLNQMHTGKWPMSIFNFTIGTNRIHTFENLASKDGFWNARHSVSKKMTDLLDQINAETDAAKSQALYEELAKAFQDESWYVAPMFVKTNMAYDDKTISVIGTPGAPVPFLYNIKPA